jgi:hypothetical protein
MRKETRTLLEESQKLLVEAHPVVEPARPLQNYSESTQMEKGPCTQPLAPHIQKLIDSGFRIEQKRSDSGHKENRGKKRPRRTRKQKEQKMEQNTTPQPNDNGQQPQANVQPMPGIQVATAYGKKALGATGRFLRLAAAAGFGTYVMLKAREKWAARAMTKAELN